ncbi:MAG: pyridoxal phosphate-dependent aminotransferase [Gammaproteobacteria bacterium]
MPRNTHHLANRMAQIAPFHVMEIIARTHELEAQGRSIIHMEVGEPDFATAAPIIAAAGRALAEGRTRYTATAGIAPLRAAIAGFYRDRFQVQIAPERIIVTPGASGALLLAAAVLVNPDEQVLMADPGYPCNRHFVRLVDGEPVAIPVGPNHAYQLDAELIDQHWGARTVAALIASPSNPTGTLVPLQALRDIVAVTERRGGCLIMDEIYQGLVYGMEPSTVLGFTDRAFVVNSFSKYFGMTGWRLGWLVAPPEYAREAEKLAQNLFISASAPAQYAALAGFTPAALAIFEERRREFEKRRDFLLPALTSLGFHIPVMPAGAFYLYADCSRFSADSFDFARRVLEEAGVAITPGIDFGAHQAERHVRIAYTNSLENLAEGVERLRRLLNR